MQPRRRYEPATFRAISPTPKPGSVVDRLSLTSRYFGKP
jgi:hypothetical protein